MSEGLELVIITGMSGAGKTVAVQSLEDLGYYCIDNMPPKLLPTFWRLMQETGKITKIALVIDLRTREFFDELTSVMAQMDGDQAVTSQILFLEADDKTLVARYKESRRSHPLSQGTHEATLAAIQKERALLASIRGRSQWIIDTSKMKPRELRAKIMSHFSAEDRSQFVVNVISFGFKYGLPIDADLVMDVRFLPNPYYVDDLKILTGLDRPVYDYVMNQPETETFYQKWIDLINYCLPYYKREGKSQLTIAVGCTGGQHRSAAMAERLGEDLIRQKYMVKVSHRDKDRNQQQVIKKVEANGSN
ncbi:RNase adapter RapZ [Facklamia hominis]|uniref:Uncharacterized protein n=1 Tax=Facklamia hominis CCUG 36813 TaxID=883111 RepID=K1MFZ6_9LACT|nr:RNase adapter RapZ [Facklamia hominis]EKB54959.1 hypothetical protein HMPREF9706_01149 [Facklamia hominis CCUG 36813]